MDWYRLDSPAPRDLAWAEECLDGEGIVIVEWPEKAGKLFERERLLVRLTKDGEAGRRLRVSGIGKRYEELAEAVSS